MRILIIISILFISCETEALVIPTNQADTFYDEFMNEASIRGYYFDRDITFTIREIDKEGLYYPDQKLIVLDSSFLGWSDNFKKFVIFHELGHHHLSRGHVDYRSIMSCCTYHQPIDSLLINELFYGQE